MEILKDYLSFRLDRELSINEEDSSAQKKYKKFFKNKLQQHGVESPAELDNAGKKKLFGEIKDEWKGASKTESEDYYTEEDLIDDLIVSIAEGLSDEPKSLSEIVDYVSYVLEECDSDLEIDVNELLENFNDVFEALINEEDGETYFTITDDVRNIIAEAEDKKSFGDSMKSHFKRNRGAYIGAGIGAGTSMALKYGSANRHNKQADAIGMPELKVSKLHRPGAILTGAGALIGNRIDKKRAAKNKAEGKPADNFR